MMDTIERATRWFFAGRNAWVLWPVGIIAVVLAIAGTGVLNGLVLGTFLIVVPLAWLVGLLGVGTRDHVRRVRAAGNQLLREAGIPALWASLYTLPAAVPARPHQPFAGACCRLGGGLLGALRRGPEAGPGTQ